MNNNQQKNKRGAETGCWPRIYSMDNFRLDFVNEKSVADEVITRVWVDVLTCVQQNTWWNAIKQLVYMNINLLYQKNNIEERLVFVAKLLEMQLSDFYMKIKLVTDLYCCLFNNYVQ